MEEVWKDVAGWEGIYSVSNLGRLMSFKRLATGRVLKNTNRTGSYFSVVLCAKGCKPKSTKMHRLVAEAFLPNPFEFPEVNHRDGDKQNNRVDNLEWCTRGQNDFDMRLRYPQQTDGLVHYNQIVRPKRIRQLCLKGILIATFDNAKLASDATGVCKRNILQVCNGEQNRSQAGGYKWAFESVVMQDAS